MQVSDCFCGLYKYEHDVIDRFICADLSVLNYFIQKKTLSDKVMENIITFHHFDVSLRNGILGYKSGTKSDPEMVKIYLNMLKNKIIRLKIKNKK